MNYAFDCILGIPWLARYQPQIDWLARSVKRRSGFDVTCAVFIDTGSGLDFSCNHERDMDVVEQEFPHNDTVVEQGFPHKTSVVEQELPHEKTVVEQGPPYHETTATSSIYGTVEDCTPVGACYVIEYVDGTPQRRRVLEVASPPRDASSITRLPGLSWKHFLCDLKDDGIEQVCLITDETIDSISTVSDGELPSHPPGAEPKLAREERFATQSWDALCDSGNPVYNIAREFADVFPDKIPAELSADRGVQHEIDLVPGSKYCVTRQWPPNQGN
ncbi:unnamed protein product [Peronospora destructor]|uniref:Polyprotein n=1 Tax=Peronospora destructor TaxID=86335 RepID=A0AAV0VE22_9STRA|nr:unnamed protein product [Peronospora destructor]